ncbi:hypothetical protein AS593_07470 [Caulobacter vibrioides]|nr:hypothetical protein AS593_07470 [Caulobacter vibrioides]
MTLTTAPDFSPGKQIGTDNPLDFAISGSGFFAIQRDGAELYTRDGAFRRDEAGRLTTAGGLAVQALGGGDIVLAAGDFEVSPDGAISQKGEFVGKLAVLEPKDGARLTSLDEGLFSAPAGSMEPTASPAVRQGALEASNVSTGDEMIAIMEAVRRAESGQRLINVYDDLMGRALSAFGQA